MHRKIGIAPKPSSYISPVVERFIEVFVGELHDAR